MIEKIHIVRMKEIYYMLHVQDVSMSYTYIILSVFQKISVPLQKLQKSMAEEKKYASIYPDLSVGEFRQLCYMAYCGEIQPSDKAAKCPISDHLHHVANTSGCHSERSAGSSS